jgi:hypothetical protein
MSDPMTSEHAILSEVVACAADPERDEDTLSDGACLPPLDADEEKHKYTVSVTIASHVFKADRKTKRQEVKALCQVRGTILARGDLDGLRRILAVAMTAAGFKESLPPLAFYVLSSRRNGKHSPHALVTSDDLSTAYDEIVGSAGGKKPKELYVTGEFDRVRLCVCWPSARKRSHVTKGEGATASAAATAKGKGKAKVKDLQDVRPAHPD